MTNRITQELLNNTLDSLNRTAARHGLEHFTLYRGNGTVKLMQESGVGMRDVSGSARGGREVYTAMNAMREALWLVAEVEPVPAGVIAARTLDNHAIKPEWSRSGEQLAALIVEAVELDRAGRIRSAVKVS